MRRAFLVQAWPLGVEDDLENQASSLVMAAGIHGARAQCKVTRSAEARRAGASVVVAVDPLGCLSKDAAAGLPASSSSAVSMAVGAAR